MNCFTTEKPEMSLHEPIRVKIMKHFWFSNWTNSSNYSNIRIVGYRIVVFDSIFGQIFGTEYYSNIRIIGTEYPNSWKEPFFAQNLDFLIKSYKILPIFMSIHEIFLNNMKITKNSIIFSYTRAIKLNWTNLKWKPSLYPSISPPILYQI